MKTVNLFFALLVTLWILFPSCGEYLDAKPDAKLAVPSSLEDLQMILDEYSTMNSNFPNIGVVIADNYYLTESDWKSLRNETQRNFYLRKADDNTIDYWAPQYRAIFHANVVLEKIETITPAPEENDSWNNIKGSALFFRGFQFYMLAQFFAPIYELETADVMLGIPLRLSPDFNKKTQRSTVHETYDRIIHDLSTAAALLPVVPLVKSRPGKPAAYGALARVYLSMGIYDKAGAYADSCLQLYSDLMDFNGLDASARAPMTRFNEEVIFQGRSLTASALSRSVAKIDSNLYRSYTENDLRKSIYFYSNGNGTYAFKGDYDGVGRNTGYAFVGIVTDEMYLIRAECEARKGNTVLAMKDLNALLEKRWLEGTFVPFEADNSTDALKIILAERRKELIFRGTRWLDLRRLMNEPEFSVTPVREMNGEVVSLTPNSPRYQLLIPRTVVELTGIKQNP